MENKNKLVFYIVLSVIALISIIGGLILLNGNGDKDKAKKDTRTTEEIIKENYEFREEDAINLIKNIFNSDNYKFEAKVSDNGLYKVTVTNTVTSSKYIYYVDPATKAYQLDMNSN